MFADGAQHLPVHEGVGGCIDQLQFQTPWLWHQANVKIRMGFHQGFTVVGFNTGIEHGQGALPEKPIQPSFASVLEPVDFKVGEDFQAAFWRYQGIDGGFGHERKSS